MSAQDYETATVTGGGKSITVSLEGVTLTTASPTMTFTVLAVPLTAENLTISFTGEEIGTRTLGLNYSDGSAVSFAPYKKFRIGGITFPVLVDGSVDDPIVWDHNVSVSDYMSWYSLARAGEGLSWDNVHIDLNSKADAYLLPGETCTRTVSARDGIGAPYSNVEVYWSSGAPGVASVDAVTGTVTAVAPGTATVTAYVYPGDGSARLTTSYTVYVNQITGVSLTSSAGETLLENATSTLTATVVFDGNSGAGYGSAIPMPSNLLSWSSGTPGVITLSNAQAQPASNRTATATATAVGIGTSDITVTVNASYATSGSATLTLTVTDQMPDIIVHEDGYTGTFRGLFVSPGVLKNENNAYTVTDGGGDQLEMLNYYGDADIYNEYFHQWAALANDFGVDGSGNLIQTPVLDSDYQEWFIPEAEAWNAILSDPPINTVVNREYEVCWTVVDVDLANSVYVTSNIYGNLITTIPGVLLFPDNATITCADLAHFDGTPNLISFDTYQALIDGGCAFLPAAGGFFWVGPDWTGIGEFGFYWSSTMSTETPSGLRVDLLSNVYEPDDWVYVQGEPFQPTDFLFPVKLVRQ